MCPRLWCLIVLVCALAAAPAAAQERPGAEPGCAYSAASAIGQRGGGVLRFPQTVGIGPDGLVYVGDQLSHIVQVFTPQGGFVREVGIAGRRAGELGAVGALAVAPDGTLLVADGRDRLDRFDATGRLLNSWGSSGTAVGQFRFGAGGGHDAPAGGGLAINGDTVFVADSINDRIQRFTLDGGHGAEIVPPGLLSYPRGLAVRGTRLIVADDKNHRLVVMDTGGHLLKTVGSGPGNGPGQFHNPFGVAMDPAGRVFVADDLNHRVVRLGPKPNYPYKARWGSYGTAPGQLAFPRGLAVDARGEIYVANTGDDRIDVFDASGTLLRSFGESGRGPAQWDTPVGAAADASGMRAVADSINGRIKLLNPDGSVAAIWGSPAPGPTILKDPVAVAFDAAGNAYVLDERRARIFVFDRATGLPGRSIGVQGSGPGQLLDPSALAIDAGGTLYVADAGNDRIARFSAAGDYLGAIPDVGTVRGLAVTPDGGRIYAADSSSRITVYDAGGEEITHFGGIGSKLGKLASPGQLALDGAGNVWVADRGHNRVQQFGPDGERLQMFGLRGIGVGEFVHPTGVAVDCHGTLTVTDTDNNRVQQFALAAAPAQPCAELSPVGNPPPPKQPTLPPPLGPEVSFKALRTRGVLKNRTVPFQVGCDTGCRLELTGTVTQRALPRRKPHRVTVKFRPVTVTLAAARQTVVRLVLSQTSALRLRRALGAHRGLFVDVQMVATASAGEPTVVTSRLKATL